MVAPEVLNQLAAPVFSDSSCLKVTGNPAGEKQGLSQVLLAWLSEGSTPLFRASNRDEHALWPNLARTRNSLNRRYSFQTQIFDGTEI